MKRSAGVLVVMLLLVAACGDGAPSAAGDGLAASDHPREAASGPAQDLAAISAAEQAPWTWEWGSASYPVGAPNR